jgi:hypothetical protein
LVINSKLSSAAVSFLKTKNPLLIHENTQTRRGYIGTRLLLICQADWKNQSDGIGTVSAARRSAAEVSQGQSLHLSG